VAYWLLKTEPSEYSYSDLEREKETVWNGVSNNLALLNLRLIRKGDLAIIYHTGEEKAAVGIVEIRSEPYADPKLKNPKLAVVDIKAKRKLKRPVTLAEIKTHPKLQAFDLLRIPRLSVVPVSQEIWTILMDMSKK
jgi:predicted RNA-binding protein with PUA-like domain